MGLYPTLPNNDPVTEPSAPPKDLSTNVGNDESATNSAELIQWAQELTKVPFINQPWLYVKTATFSIDNPLEHLAARIYDRCIWNNGKKQHKGTLRFVGYVRGYDDVVYAGIEFDKYVGTSNGSVQGKQVFKTGSKKAGFVPLSQVKKLHNNGYFTTYKKGVNFAEYFNYTLHRSDNQPPTSPDSNVNRNLISTSKPVGEATEISKPVIDAKMMQHPVSTKDVINMTTSNISSISSISTQTDTLYHIQSFKETQLVNLFYDIMVTFLDVSFATYVMKKAIVVW